MLRCLVAWAVAGLFFLTATVPAASQETTEPLSLEEVVEMAAGNNRLVTEAVEKSKAAMESRKSALADFFPKASANYRYTDLDDAPFSRYTFGLPPFIPDRVFQREIANDVQYHWDVTLTQPLFTGFALQTRYRMAKIGIELKEVEKEQAVQDVIKEAKVGYFGVLLADKIREVAEETVMSLEAHVTDAKNFYTQGMIPYNDLLQSEVALANAVQTRLKTRGQLEMAVSSLNVLMGIDLNHKTRLKAAALPKDTDPVPDLDALRKEALRKRPELGALALASRNMEQAITLAGSTYYPQIALVGRYEQNGENPVATKNDFSNRFNSSITLNGEWTFFEWGKTRAEVAKLRHERLALQERIKGVQESIQLEVKGAFVNLNVARESITTAGTAVTQAEENLRITNLQYQQQMATSTQVLDARAFLTQARSNYYAALYSYLISLAELERAVGRR